MSPIRPENRARYPRDWKTIADAIRERGEQCCECDGRCHGRSCNARHTESGTCDACNGRTHPITGSLVVLTVAHLDHTPENCDPANLLAMCQACHLSYDAEHHAQTARATRAAALAEQMDPLFQVTP